MKLPARQIATIFFFIIALVAVIVLKQRCSQSVEGMFRALDVPGDGGK
jgi:hypothetical protein